MKNYTEQAQNLAKAIDIAISVFQKHPPKGFEPQHIDHIINTYLEFRTGITNPKSEFINLKSLKFIINDVFTYFQESTGETVNVFWKKIKENNLPYKRENKLTKIIKRGKIKNQIEYDFVIDVLVPYQQEGIIDENDTHLIKTLLDNYEQRRG